MPDDIEQRIKQLESDLALAQHNIAQLIQWVESHIFATETSDRRKTEADHRFLKGRYNV